MREEMRARGTTPRVIPNRKLKPTTPIAPEEPMKYEGFLKEVKLNIRKTATKNHKQRTLPKNLKQLAAKLNEFDKELSSPESTKSTEETNNPNADSQEEITEPKENVDYEEMFLNSSAADQEQ